MQPLADFSVSAIIPTRNRPDDLAIVMQSLLEQTRHPAEIIVVDQSESDEGRRRVESAYANAPEAVRRAVRLDYVSDPTISGGAVARNRAIDIARGNILMFLDDDVVLEAEYVERLLEAYRTCPEADGVSGIIANYARPSLGFRWWTECFVRGPFRDERQPIYWNAERLRHSPPIQVSSFTGAVASFRRDRVGALRFDASLTGGSLAEDVDFCMRLPDAALWIAPRARLVHNRSASGRANDHWLRAHTQAAYYLYQRNLDRGVKNRLCFVWLNLGYAFLIAAISAKRGSLVAWHAFVEGVREANRILGGRMPTPRIAS